MYIARHFQPSFVFSLLMACIAVLFLAASARAEPMAFRQAVAEAAASDKDIAAFYQASGYAAVWTGRSDAHRARRTALIDALSQADLHGLPVELYDAPGLAAEMAEVRSERDRGFLEVAFSKRFLTYARDVQTGILVPSQVDKHIVREVPYRDRQSYLVALTQSVPRAYFKTLPPDTMEYRALMKQKLLLKKELARGGWGAPVRSSKLEPGDSGPAVVALRDRLVRLGYLKRSASPNYDAALTRAVQAFQADNGLAEDGIAGQGTLTEINRGVDDRLRAVLVAMERERWMNKERGVRHIEVNLTDFSAKIIDKGRVTFRTRSVIGATDAKRQSLEFSDEMDHMVINPSWFVPRSIATGEYLPKLKANPYAVNHLILTDSRGRRIDRSAVDFTRYSSRSFPYAMRQPPGQSNALGLVKFMFPNAHNIYLHDTPHKKLFARETRAFSHGCIRLAEPFDFAYALLAAQTDDPKGFFQAKLATGREIRVDLEAPVPVHLIYRTAFADEKGQVKYRRDVYGRDARIWDAMAEAGVALQSAGG